VIIKPPKKENLLRVKEEVAKILYPLEEDEIYEINFNKKKKTVFFYIFNTISLIAGSLTAYAIFWVFKIAGVPWTSLYVDTINVAMVVSAAMVIRHKSKEMTIADSGSILTSIVDLFSLPLAKVGQWVSNTWKEYNILSVFFTALVDTPFSGILSIIEEWRSFLQDKRSEIH